MPPYSGSATAAYPILFRKAGFCHNTLPKNSCNSRRTWYNNLKGFLAEAWETPFPAESFRIPFENIVSCRFCWRKTRAAAPALQIPADLRTWYNNRKGFPAEALGDFANPNPADMTCLLLNCGNSRFVSWYFSRGSAMIFAKGGLRMDQQKIGKFDKFFAK